MERGRGANIPHLVRRQGCTQLIVDGRPWIMRGAEVQNSSASSLAFMAPIWGRLADLGCNTILVPVSWELIEPTESAMDFALVDGLLAGARGHGLRLVLLWFGTWKNAVSQYVPAWVKTDLRRFPRAQAEGGGNTRAVSSFSRECLQADARCFASLMRHLARVDSRRRTVIMVQLENETGVLGSPRDFRPEATEAFQGLVPLDLCQRLFANNEALHPLLREAGKRAGGQTPVTWTGLFGSEAPEVFMAWHVARFVEDVCRAGKAEYPLPMYVNAWLDYGSAPGGYPSGGPVARVLDIWRAAAPSVDVYAPDIYVKDFKGACADYHGSGNPLLIPETGASDAAANVFWALAQHDAIGFSPFGIDGPHPWGARFPHEAPGLREAYELLTDLAPLIAEHQGTGRMRGILQTADSAETIDIGSFRLQVSYPAKAEDEGARGRGLVIALEQGLFLVAGRGFSVRFLPADGARQTVDLLSVDEGTLRKGTWLPGRRLNGDDTLDGVVRLEETRLCLRRVRLYSHALDGMVMHEVQPLS